MLLFRIKTEKSIELIGRELRALEENEKHNYFLMQDYSDSRVGLHLYINGNKVKGYYENGERSRGNLGHFKTWFWSKSKRKNNTTTVWAFVSCNLFIPLIAVIGIIGMAVGCEYMNIVKHPSILFPIICILILLIFDIREEILIYSKLCDIYN